uniref:Cystatin n=1 Tax=Rhipicephalus zambeziensis TaxID=60191 RepID=A0A224YCF7_9ACAR
MASIQLKEHLSAVAAEGKAYLTPGRFGADSSSVSEKGHMVTRKAVIFLMGLLLGFCDESFGASGWTEVRNPDTYTNRALAEFAYAEKKTL